METFWYRLTQIQKIRYGKWTLKWRDRERERERERENADNKQTN